MTMPDPRVNVTPEDVGMVVSKFYAAVREHPVLGPVFYLIIGQSEALWREHEEKNCSVLAKCYPVRKGVFWKPDVGAFGGICHRI